MEEAHVIAFTPPPKPEDSNEYPWHQRFAYWAWVRVWISFIILTVVFLLSNLLKATGAELAITLLVLGLLCIAIRLGDDVSDFLYGVRTGPEIEFGWCERNSGYAKKVSAELRARKQKPKAEVINFAAYQGDSKA